jgi:hypothetical protein
VTGIPHTSDPHNRPRLLSPHQKNHIPLTRIDIIVLEEKRLIHAVFLQRRKLNKQIQWACKRLLKNQVLLSSDLEDYISMLRFQLDRFMISSVGWTHTLE